MINFLPFEFSSWIPRLQESSWLLIFDLRNPGWKWHLHSTSPRTFLKHGGPHAGTQKKLPKPSYPLVWQFLPQNVAQNVGKKNLGKVGLLSRGAHGSPKRLSHEDKNASVKVPGDSRWPLHIFSSPSWRSLSLWKGHKKTIPNRSPAELPGMCCFAFLGEW